MRTSAERSADAAQRSTITLHAGEVTAVIDPMAGGRLASLRVAGEELLVTDGDHPHMWGGFPMAPWAGRLGRSSVHIDGREITVAPTPDDPHGHALHGLVATEPWEVIAVDTASAELRCALAWDLGGHAQQVMRLEPTQMTWELSVTAGAVPMFAQVGWHLWLRRPARIDLAATARYERGPDALPTGTLVDPGAGPWDDCFVVSGPTKLRRATSPTELTIEADTDHVVVFDRLESGIAIEPQSGPPDAFHLEPRRVEGGERLAHRLRIGWATPSGAAGDR